MSGDETDLDTCCYSSSDTTPSTTVRAIGLWVDADGEQEVFDPMTGVGTGKLVRQAVTAVEEEGQGAVSGLHKNADPEDGADGRARHLTKDNGMTVSALVSLRDLYEDEETATTFQGLKPHVGGL